MVEPTNLHENKTLAAAPDVSIAKVNKKLLLYYLSILDDIHLQNISFHSFIRSFTDILPVSCTFLQI